MTTTAAAPGLQLFCPECGYDLRAIGSDRCPECGTAVDRATLPESRIPWVHRRTIGRRRAYRRTVWLVMLRPRRLGGEAARPVSYREARRFRVVTSLVAGLPPAALLVGAIVWFGGAHFLGLTRHGPFIGRAFPSTFPWVYNLIIPWDAGVAVAPVLPLAFLLLPLLATGVGGYWFHPKSLPVVRQNRAVALSEYACAPLVWLWVPLLSLGACEAAVAFLEDWGGGRNSLEIGARTFALLELTFVLVALLVLLAWWRSTLVLLRVTTQAGAGRLALAAVALPLAWAGCAVLALVVFPWVVGYVRLIVGSFG